MTSFPESESSYSPKEIISKLWFFPTNGVCEGWRAWWLDVDPEPWLIDCPPITKQNIESLKQLAQGRKARIFLTCRDGHGKVQELQKVFNWHVVMQEQEAYLLPGLSSVETFEEEFVTTSGLRALWTPGPTPGSSAAYISKPCNVLFCGRLLIPVAENRLASLRTSSTFHWPRQQKSLEKLIEWIPSNAFPSLASAKAPPGEQGGGLMPWTAWRSMDFN